MSNTFAQCHYADAVLKNLLYFCKCQYSRHGRYEGDYEALINSLLDAFGIETELLPKDAFDRGRF